jgi:DcmR-like sensory protein
VEQRIELGIHDERAHVGDHIAYLWETDQEFEAAVGFLETGRREGDFCVIFGHDEANQRVVDALNRRGFDCARLQETKRLAIVGGHANGDAILENLGAAFATAVEDGAPLIRLLGNIGWNRGGWPAQDDLITFEARVTGAARQFPCVVVCMYDVSALPAAVLLHGALETHPLTFCRNVMRRNPYLVETTQLLRQRTPQ